MRFVGLLRTRIEGLGVPVVLLGEPAPRAQHPLDVRSRHPAVEHVALEVGVDLRQPHLPPVAEGHDDDLGRDDGARDREQHERHVEQLLEERFHRSPRIVAEPIFSSVTRDNYCAATAASPLAAPRPNRSYSAGNTNRFKSADVNSPPRMTIAMGYSTSHPG